MNDFQTYGIVSTIGQASLEELSAYRVEARCCKSSLSFQISQTKTPRSIPKHASSPPEQGSVRFTALQQVNELHALNRSGSGIIEKGIVLASVCVILQSRLRVTSDDALGRPMPSDDNYE